LNWFHEYLLMLNKFKQTEVVFGRLRFKAQQNGKPG
jgi:hypothetical protein